MRGLLQGEALLGHNIHGPKGQIAVIARMSRIERIEFSPAHVLKELPGIFDEAEACGVERIPLIQRRISRQESERVLDPAEVHLRSRFPIRIPQLNASCTVRKVEHAHGNLRKPFIVCG